MAEEIPEAIPVGSLYDEASQVQVYGDFLPFYVDLQVTWNEAVNDLPDAGIGEILSAYELKLWDLKEDKEYELPEGKKVTVMIPLPDNAGEFSELAIAHYLGNNSYEYFSFSHDGKTGNMTIEERDGREYLVFETASFSPFNVGGLQLVGPGASLDQGSGADNTQTGTAQTGNTQQNNTAGTGTSSTAGSSSAGTSNSAIPPKTTVSTGTSSTGTASAGSTGSSSSVSTVGGVSGPSRVRVTRAVRTGDEMPVLPYLAAAAAAAAAGVGAVFAGKKRRSSADASEQE